jgi:hypothetical protein
MGRRRKSASVAAVTLPKFGPNGDLARPENARVQALIARDASDAERESRRKRHGYNDQPAAPRHYESLDMDKTVGERRYRALPADHPLVKAWVKRKISDSEFDAGNLYRLIFERANDPAGRDSTAVLNRVTASGAGGVPNRVADAQACKDSLADLNARMGEIDRQLVEKFCGLALSLSASVDSSVLCAPAGRLFRMREALRSLERAIQGGKLPEIAPELTQARRG